MSIESRIRETLVEQRVDELLPYHFGEYKPRFIELSEKVMKDISSLSAFKEYHFMGLGDLKEYIKLYFEPFLQEDSELAKAMLHKQVNHDLTFISVTEVQIYASEPGYKRFSEIMMGTALANDRIIGRLVRIGETEGIEKAVKKETRYDVLRKMFPTIEDYRKTFEPKMKGLEIIGYNTRTKISKALKEMCAGKPDFSKKLNSLITYFTEEAIGIVLEIEQKCLDKQIVDIYGKEFFN